MVKCGKIANFGAFLEFEPESELPSVVSKILKKMVPNVYFIVY